MEEQEPQFDKNEQKMDLARAVARGQSIVVWRARTTCPYGRRTIGRTSPRSANRRRCGGGGTLNQAIGRMARDATAAADGIKRLARGADSESVRLAAWRAILADQMAVAKFSTLEQRMTELEEEREQQQLQQEQQFGPQYGGR